MSIYNAAGSYGDEKQDLSLIEKKKLQWSQEKADQNEWFPFGRKDDYRSRKSSHIVNNNESTPVPENNSLTTAKTAIKTTKGQIVSPNALLNLDTNGIGGALLSQTGLHYGLISQPTDKVIHVHIGPPGPNAFVPSQPSSSIINVVPTVNSNNGYTSANPTKILVPSPSLIGETFPGVMRSLNSTHQQSILIHQTPVQEHNLNNVGYLPANYFEFKNGYMDSNDSFAKNRQNPHEYTEQWANQLDNWKDFPSADDKAANLIYNNFNEKFLAMRQDNRSSVAAASQHPSTFVCSTPVQQNFHQPNTSFALNQPLPMAYVSPLIFNSETQRTVISPLASKPSSISGQDFVDPVYQGFNCFSPRNINGPDEGLISNSYGNNNAVKINDEALAVEQKLKTMENKVAIEKQIMEKQRLKALETERERIENERFEKERQLIELKEKLQNQKELTRWKELQRDEERREASVKEALEKARLEAQLHRKQKLYKHANSSRSIDDSDHSINNNNELALFTSTNSSSVLSDSAISVPFLSSSNVMTNSMIDFDRANESLMIAAKNSTSQSPSLNFNHDPSDYSVVYPTPAVIANESRSRSLPPSQNDEPFWRSSKNNNAQNGSNNTGFSTSNVRNAADERPIKPMDENAYSEWQRLAAENVNENNSKTSTTTNGSKVDKKNSIRKSRSVATSKATGGRRSESLNNQNAPKQSIQRIQDSKVLVDKVVKTEETATVESRLPSAATYIIRREAIFEPKSQPNENAIEITKSPSPRKVVAITEPSTDNKLIKSKSESAFKPLLTKKSNADNTAEKQCSPKTGGSSGSRTIEAPDDDIPNSNPWGDQFGGLNPLLHRLSTRKKVRQVQLQQHLDASFNLPSPLQPTKVLSKAHLSGASSPQKDPNLKSCNNVNTTPKLPHRTLERGSLSKEEKKNDQLSTADNNNNNSDNPLLQKITTRKKVCGSLTQNVKLFGDDIRSNKDTPKNKVNEGAKDDNSLRLSKNDIDDICNSEIFTKKNTVYRSFAVRSKRANEKQSDMLKQLSSLKEQLKMSQRVVENSMRTKTVLSKPEAVVMPNNRLYKQV